MMLEQKLTTNFRLGELVRSETAERHDHIMAQQIDPPEKVLEALLMLCQVTLQPIRDMVQSPVGVTSGYRCLDLNRLLGSEDTSAHPKGNAGDLTLPRDERVKAVIRRVNLRVMERIGKPVRADANLNFYLFALICLNLHRLDIDQVIHEYGSKYGQPAWVHASSSQQENKREILAIGRYVNTENHVRVLTVEEALQLGV